MPDFHTPAAAYPAARVAEILENISDAFLALDLEWRVTYMNRRAEQLLGTAREKLLGRSLWEAFPQAVGSTSYQEYHRAVEAQVTVAFETYGTVMQRWVSVRAYPTPEGLTIYFQEAGEERRMQEALRLGESLLTRIVETQQEIATAALDSATVLVLAAERAEELTGATGAVVEMAEDEEMVYRAASGAARPHLGLRIRRVASLSGLCLETGEALLCADTESDPRVDRVATRRIGARSMAVVPISHEGASIGVLKVFSSEVDAFGSRELSTLRLITGLIGAAMAHAAEFDERQQLLLERTRALETLVRSEERFRALTEYATDIVVILDIDGVIAYASPAARTVLGYAPEELLGVPALELVHPEDREQVGAALQQQRESTATISTISRVRTRTGEWRVLGGRGSNHLSDPAVRGIVVNLRDITEFVNAREQLRESETRFRIALAAAPIPMALVSIEGHVQLANDAFRELFGYSDEELVRLSIAEITHPDDLELDLAHMRRLLEGEATSYQIEKRYIHRKGHVVWAQLTVSVVRGPDGAPLYGIAQVQDIGERHAAEELLARAMAELRRSNQELEQFAYVASHDLQEPLRKIQAFGDRLSARYADTLGEQGRDYVARMQAAAGRMQRLIQELLALSRVGTQGRPFEWVDLAELARDVLSDLESRLNASGGVVELGELPALNADPMQVRQLLQNLIGNALKFHAPGVPPRVRIWGERADVEGRAGVRLYVSDEGIGFEETYLDRIFAPFQRLHARMEYEGSGMGLAICKKIAERHGGGITAKSTPGEGTTFIVTLSTYPEPGHDA